MKTFKRLSSILLASVMVFGAMPIRSISAAETPFVPDEEMIMIDDRDAAVEYTGSWTPETLSGSFQNTHTWSANAAANMVTVYFSGDSFSIVGVAASNHSKADVFIDGVKAGAAEFAAGTRATKHLAYVSPVLENAPHEVKIITTEATKAGSFDALFYTNIQDKPFYHIDKDSYNVSKSAGTVDFKVYRQGKTGTESKVKVSTEASTATAGTHFVAKSEELTFAAGETEKTFSVEMLSAANSEGLLFNLRLDPAGGEDCYLNENYSVAAVTLTDAAVQETSLKATFADPGRRYGVIGVNQSVPGDLSEVRAMNKTEYTAAAWKGDTVSAQILLSTDNLSAAENITVTASDLVSGGNEITDVKTSPVQYVRASTGRAAPNTNIEMVPDIIATPTSDFGDMAKESILPVWISIDIPRDAAAGTYNAAITVDADGLDAPLEFDIGVEVLDLIQPLPSQNQFYLDLWQYPYTSARYYGVEPWSDEHWKYLEEEIAAYRDAGGTTITATAAYNPWGLAPAGQTQQTYDVYPGMIKWTRISGSGTTAEFEFDYTVFDNWVEFNIANGVDQQIDCYGIVPWGNRNQFYDADSRTIITETFATGDAKWQHYWSQMLDSFIEHLYEKGWMEIAYIATDERPITDMEHVVALVKSKKAPDGSVLKITSALNYGLTSGASDVLDQIDHVSLNIDEVEESFTDFVADRRAKGLNTTVYTCTGNYPNSFTRSQPAESAWMMYYSQKFEANGFLRWAFDAWTMEPRWSTDHWFWESGDCFQLYPAQYGETEPASSPPFEILKQGIRDVEKANYLKRIDPSVKDDINELFASITKPVLNTDYTNSGSGDTPNKIGTAAGNEKMQDDSNRIHDGLITIAKAHINSNPTPATFTVTFDKNDGSGTYETMTVTSPDVVLGSLPDEPTRADYAFTGWNTKENAAGLGFTANSTVTGDLTVYAKWDSTLPDPSVVLNTENVTIKESKTFQLLADVYPENSAVTWTSGDKDIATVDQTGLVTAIAPGDTTVTAAIDGGYQATAAINVTTKINLSLLTEASAESNGDEAANLAAKNAIDGSKDYGNNTTRWSSTVGIDTKWLQVDLGGKKRFEEIVLEWERKNANDYSISISDNGTDFTEIKTFTDYPAAFTDVIKFDTPVNARYVRLTVNNFRETDSNRFGASSTWKTVGLFEFEIWGFPIEKEITLDKEVLGMTAEDTAQLSATIEPEWITEEVTAVWTSSNTSIAAVDQDGLVTAVAPGEAVITASIGDGISDSAIVSVYTVPINKPVFEDTEGNSLSELPDGGSLITTLLRRNDSAEDESLVMYVAVYTPEGRLYDSGTDSKTVGAGEAVEFSVTMQLSDSLADGHYANVFVWDSDTFVPVMKKFRLE